MKIYAVGLQMNNINITIVNDIAETVTKLISDYNEILMDDEEQKQCIIQLLDEYRKSFPDV